MDNNENIKAPTEDERLTDREVMEHTASIWKYKPIRDDGMEMHSEQHTKYTRVSQGEIFGARVRGKKHKHDGTNCDDWFETAASDKFFIAVVSDGAGSKTLSRVGARLCCEGAVQYLKAELAALFENEADITAKLSSDISGDEFMYACKKLAPLVQEAARRSFDNMLAHFKTLYNDEQCRDALGRKPLLSDLYCTCLAAVVIPLMVDGKQQCFAATVQIGDGCICAINSKAPADSCLRLLGEADSGAYSGETDFLSEKTLDDTILAGKTRICRGEFDAVMLMTDGAADDYFPAEPMMKRLYLDLGLNGIVQLRGIVPRKEAPAPIEYPSVSREGGNVTLQYAKQIEQDADKLWELRDCLKSRSLQAYGISLGDSAEKRLCVWLDNYNERGSFDDRTLVLILPDAKDDNR